MKYSKNNLLINDVDAIDTITDFSVVDDAIQVVKSGFGGESVLSILDSDRFYIGSLAHDSSDPSGNGKVVRFIFNKTTEALFFDIDGRGGTGQVQIAKRSPGLSLTRSNFL